MESNVWQQFFDGYAAKYEQEIFTRHTQAEVIFLLEELQLPQGSAILDMGCGTGRHSVALALAGYHVTGVDISAGMLAQAQNAAGALGVDVEWVQSDALLFDRQESFDAALSLCEGSLCLLGSQDDSLTRDETVLGNMSRALRPGGKMIVNVLSACRMIRKVTEKDLSDGLFSLETLTEPSSLEISTVDGIKTAGRERYYTPPELAGMLQRSGIEVEHIWGGSAGAWNRQPLRLDEFEIMAVGHKRTPAKA